MSEMRRITAEAAYHPPVTRGTVRAVSAEADSPIQRPSASRVGPLIGFVLVVGIWWPFLTGSGFLNQPSDWNRR
jgi:hypothetical protein